MFTCCVGLLCQDILAHVFRCPASTRLRLIQKGLFGVCPVDVTVDQMKRLVAKSWDDFRQWRKQARIPCSQGRWSLGCLLTNGEPMLKLKGYNSRVVTQWLSQATKEAARCRPEDLELQMINVCMQHVAIMFDCCAQPSFWSAWSSPPPPRSSKFEAAQLRGSLSSWFNSLESSSRYLRLRLLLL